MDKINQLLQNLKEVVCKLEDNPNDPMLMAEYVVIKSKLNSSSGSSKKIMYYRGVEK